MKLTNREREFLAFIECGRPVRFSDMARAMGRKLFSLSGTRNKLYRMGCIETWNNWEDFPRITSAGRRALEGGSDG